MKWQKKKLRSNGIEPLTLRFGISRATITPTPQTMFDFDSDTIGDA
jgi:hypothetical protein